MAKKIENMNDAELADYVRTQQNKLAATREEIRAEILAGVQEIERRERLAKFKAQLADVPEEEKKRLLQDLAVSSAASTSRVGKPGG